MPVNQKSAKIWPYPFKKESPAIKGKLLPFRNPVGRFWRGCDLFSRQLYLPAICSFSPLCLLGWIGLPIQRAVGRFGLSAHLRRFHWPFLPQTTRWIFPTAIPPDLPSLFYRGLFFNPPHLCHRPPLCNSRKNLGRRSLEN
jgi:hypothetical protein